MNPPYSAFVFVTCGILDTKCYFKFIKFKKQNNPESLTNQTKIFKCCEF